MTDVQLYLAIGIPSGLFALNFIALLWQARGLERSFNVRFDALEHIMNAKFEAVNAKFEAQTQGLLRVEQVLDARLRHLEEG